jgi:hypothetical protein
MDLGEYSLNVLCTLNKKRLDKLYQKPGINTSEPATKRHLRLAAKKARIGSKICS